MVTPKDNEKNLYNVLIITWPNLISLARLLSVPVIAWMLLEEYYLAAFTTFIFAGLSDLLDGFVARVLKTPSKLGVYLDPLADKVLLIGVFFLLGFKGALGLWFVLLVIFRDVLILGGVIFLYMLEKPFKIKPLMVSKINTLLQIITCAWVLGDLAFHFDVPLAKQLLVLAVASTTIFSGGAYMLRWLRCFAQNEASR